MTWIILYVKNARIGSLPLTDDNLAWLKNRLCLSLIQKDRLGGHEHYHVLGFRPTKRGKPCTT